MPMFRFNKYYFILTIILLITEVLIAIFLKTGFIRHYVGDFLVVILIYCFVKSFLKVPVLYAAVGVLLFAFLIEFLQYLEFVKWVGLKNNKLANVVLGNYFEWADMLAYTLGIAAVLLAEKFYRKIVSSKDLL